MSMFACPICGMALQAEGKTLRCANGHSYDLARQGYVNLLMSQQSAKKRHGDDKRMVVAREQFLEKGYYQPLLDQIVRDMAFCVKGDKASEKKPYVCLDVGCGECWYTAQMEGSLTDSGLSAVVGGIDISKDALIAGRLRSRTLELAVASAAHIPVADGSCHLVTNIFAPLEVMEFGRILVDNGFIIRVIPAEDHLFELKELIYDHPYRNPAEDTALSGFSLIWSTRLRYSLTLTTAADIQHLFCMTPYFYKTGADDQKKLMACTSLTTTADFYVLLYLKE